MKHEKFILKGALWIAKELLKVRYTLSIKGEDLLKQDGTKLFLPNHQAIVDPILLLPQIYKYSSAVPVVTEHYYNMPVVGKLFKYWGAISVSDLEAGSRDTGVLDEICTKTTNCLQNGVNVIIYPAGQIAGQGFEKIINKQSAWKIVDSLPNNTRVIGIRIGGLWGSHWSKAWTGKSPNFLSTFLKSIGIILGNLLFFLPKRKISLEFEDITDELTRRAKDGRKPFNTALESFYNINGEEPVTYIRHFFYLPAANRKLPEQISGSVYDINDSATIKSLDDLPYNTYKKVSSILAKSLNIKEDEITIESNLMLDLGCDSLNLVEIISEMEKVFPQITIPDNAAIRTVSDLCLSTMGQLEGKSPMKEQHFTEPFYKSSRISIPPTTDIVTQFLKLVKENPNEWIFYDEMIGSSRRRDFLVKSLVIAKLIQDKCNKKNVGILLPASQSATLLILSCYLAGKTPVMLNWTVGKKNLQNCIDTSDVDQILTASKFVSKINDQLPESLHNHLILIDVEARRIGVLPKISALIKAHFPSLIKHRSTLFSTGVILFTSGSEDLPKAVPLTQKNIISNLSSVFKSIDLPSELVFVGFLPPFHSFGFTVLSILPLLSGVRVGYSPDPTDGKTIAKLIKHLQANVILGSPGFLKIILSNGSKSDFASLKFAISGAEAMPDALWDLFNLQTENAKLLEGYGITECSPVLTLNPIERQKKGSVGKFITDVKSVIVSLDGRKIEPANKEGMIYVYGDNIFSGYLNSSFNPFETINGLKYYKTGDLGYIDEDGYLFITGRLKRFIKIGGEMVSLPFIEKVLSAKYGNNDEVNLAVEGSDKTTPVKIVLFTNQNLDIDEVNKYLIRSGVSPIAKIREIISLKEIPVLGSGKTDYKALKQLIEN